MMNVGMGYGWGLGIPAWAPTMLALFIIWALFWKGLGLWHSARRGQGWWFIAILVLNTAGILEIIYLFAVAKVKADRLFNK